MQTAPEARTFNFRVTAPGCGQSFRDVSFVAFVIVLWSALYNTLAYLLIE